MRNRTVPIRLLLVTVVFACGTLGATHAEEHDDHGNEQIPTIDLRDHDFARDGLAQLDGEWAMYWHELLDPGVVPNQPSLREGRAGLLEGVSSAGSPTPFVMPRTWNSYELDNGPIGGSGYASFVVRVLLPPELERGALRVPPAS
ncbi:MAG TPA: hypothetical protein VJ932_07555, partial [Alkalispirochaeta sp.]|nr:hypothetical protein [Alkalispirochaeta sp.]